MPVYSPVASPYGMRMVSPVLARITSSWKPR